MPIFAENFGLEFLFEEDETAMGFMIYLMQEGKAIHGYYGCPTLFNSMGDIDFYVRTQKGEDGKLVVVGLDTHCCGTSYWVMKNTGIDITPEDAHPTDRVFLFSNAEDNEGMVPVCLVNADILPSFMEDDTVKMQVCALPLRIDCYSDEEEYAASQPADKEGRKLLVADGSLLPFDFLVNHSQKQEDPTSVKRTDALVTFRAEVKALYYGFFDTPQDDIDTFIRCVVDTRFGELIFAFTIEQIPEEQREKLCVGAVIAGTCILSGDVAILEYENGLVRDYEHNLRLLRQTFVHGEAERMRSVLREDAVCISETTGKTYAGADEIIRRFDLVHDNQTEVGDQTIAVIVTISQAEEGMKYPVGTRCIAIAYGEKHNYASIVFVTVDEDGYITEIDISQDYRYRFTLE